MIDLQAYNNLLNVDKHNNSLLIGDDIIEIPIGSYELDGIYKYVNKYLYNVHQPIESSIII